MKSKNILSKIAAIMVVLVVAVSTNIQGAVLAGPDASDTDNLNTDSAFYVLQYKIMRMEMEGLVITNGETVSAVQESITASVEYVPASPSIKKLSEEVTRSWVLHSPTLFPMNVSPGLPFGSDMFVKDLSWTRPHDSKEMTIDLLSTQLEVSWRWNDILLWTLLGSWILFFLVYVFSRRKKESPNTVEAQTLEKEEGK